jgi:hypothetical protein
MQQHGPIAAVVCPQCPSDPADAWFVKDPVDGTLVATVLRCKVCGYLQIA